MSDAPFSTTYKVETFTKFTNARWWSVGVQREWLHSPNYVSRIAPYEPRRRLYTLSAELPASFEYLGHSAVEK